MDFYAHQDRARGASRRLGALFVLSLIAVVVAVNFAAMLAWWLLGGATHPPRYFVLTNTMVTLLVVLGGAWVEVHRLRERGSVLAQRLGARSLDEADPLHRRLRDVVEEVAIGAGVPVPALYVLDDPSINALAAGERPALAAVMVTRGALERLERAELQGVAAHEIAHIVGGDTALNTQLTGALYGLCSLRLMGFRMLERALDRDDEGALLRLGFVRIVMMVAGALLSAVGMLGVGAAQLLRAAISRQREFLADALAVQITRDRDGLGGALRRIAGEAEAPLCSAYAPLVSHFLLVRPAGLRDWFRTHPPLTERIRRLYGRRMSPIVRPDHPGRSRARLGRDAATPAASGGHPRFAGSGSTGAQRASDAADHARRAVPAVQPASPEELLELETIPFVRVSQAMDEPWIAYPAAATTTVRAGAAAAARPSPPATLLITRIRAASLGFDAAGRWLEALVGAGEVDETDADLGAALRWVLSPSGAVLRVPLLELLLARVRRWSSAHRRELLERCRRAVELDGRVEPSEWIYYTLARHRLLPTGANAARLRKAATSKAAQSRALAALFAMAAAIGEASARNTRDALADAAAMLEVSPPAATPDEVGTSELTQALDILLGLPPLDKPILLKVLRTLARTPGESNYEAFLRAVAAAIDCPVPRRDPSPVADPGRVAGELVA